MSRQDKEVGENSRVCSNHFVPENFRNKSADKKNRSKTSKKLAKLLKDNAYPSLPSHFGSAPC